MYLCVYEYKINMHITQTYYMLTQSFTLDVINHLTALVLTDPGKLYALPNQNITNILLL